MRKFAPYFLLAPPVLLLFYLPSTFRGESAYPMTLTTLILSIFVWIFLFCAVLCFSRGSCLTRPFVGMAAVVALIRIIYRFEIGQTGLLYFLTWLFIICGFYVLFFIFSPPVRQGNQKPDKKVA
jgi:hypothetical protein